MSIAQTISNAGASLGRGLENRANRKRERTQLITRLGTYDEFADKKDDLEELSLSELRGLEEGWNVRQGQAIQQRKAQEQQMQMQKLQQEMELAKEKHVTDTAIKEADLMRRRKENQNMDSYFDVDMQTAKQKQEAHAARMAEQERKANAPQPGTVTEIAPGVRMVNIGNGQHQILRDEPAEGFKPVKFPDGSTKYEFTGDINKLITEDGKKVFNTPGMNPLALFAAMMGEQTPEGAQAPAAATAPAQAARQLSARDKAAIEWAQANPDDPRSKQILKRNGL